MITTIQVDEKTKHKLDGLRMYPRETYNDLILRLLESPSLSKVDRESLIETLEVLSDPESMRDIAEALKEFNIKRGKSLEQIEKELGF